VVVSQSGLICKPGLKTQKKRIFPINNRLAGLLKSIQPVDVSGEAKVFPSPEGKWIDMHNLSGRAWKVVVESLDGVEYRKLYQTRHTFITPHSALQNVLSLFSIKIPNNVQIITY
jgi:integrase